MKSFLKFQITLFAILLISVSGFAQVSNQRKTHIVKTNETLFSIAQEYNVSIRDLRKWNNLKGNTIKIGQSLFVSPPHDKRPENATQSSVKKQNNNSNNNFLTTETPGRAYYTVKPGDNLYKVARKFNMTISQIKQLNKLKSNTLNIGQRLLIKAPISAPSVSSNNMKSTPQGKFTRYKVKRGDKLQSLLKKYQMDKNEFHALNPDISGNSLYPGQEVTILLPPTVTHKNPYLLNGNAQSGNTIKAVVYDSTEIAQPTTNGDLYNPDALTAASPSLPLGTIAYVINPANKKGIFVLINDRTTGDYIKLSRKAYNELGLNSAHSHVQVKKSGQ
jgi:LysM repeat protein